MWGRRAEIGTEIFIFYFVAIHIITLYKIHTLHLYANVQI